MKPIKVKNWLKPLQQILQLPLVPPYATDEDAMDVEGLAPFVEFNRRRAVERAWESEARAKPGGWHKPGEGEGRRYWADGKVELAAGGTRGKTMHDAAGAGDAAAVARRLARG